MSVSFEVQQINALHEFNVPVRYTDLAKIGEGSYGLVCSALDTVGNRRVAIKQIKIRSGQDQIYQLKKIYREFHLMNLCYHPGIVDLYEVFTPAKVATQLQSIYIVAELMDQNLTALVREDKNNLLTFDHISYIIYQLVCGLKYLNSMEILHRDLKPGNITIKHDQGNIIVKIIDMGLARTLAPDGGSMTAGNIQTLIYRAPELILNSGTYDKKIDIWSIGCVLGFMLKKAHIFLPPRQGKARPEIEYMKTVVECLGQPPQRFVPAALETELGVVDGGDAAMFVTELTQRFQDTSDTKVADAKDALVQMFRYSSTDRISIEQLLQHPFLTSWRTGGGAEEVPPSVLTSEVIQFNNKLEGALRTANADKIKEQIFRDIRRSWGVSPGTSLHYQYQTPYPVTALSVLRMFTPLVCPVTFLTLDKGHSVLWRGGVSVLTLCVTLAGVEALRKIFD